MRRLLPVFEGENLGPAYGAVAPEHVEQRPELPNGVPSRTVAQDDGAIQRDWAQVANATTVATGLRGGQEDRAEAATGSGGRQPEQFFYLRNPLKGHWKSRALWGPRELRTRNRNCRATLPLHGRLMWKSCMVQLENKDLPL